jgi:SAM-dependent methyltransferase
MLEVLCCPHDGGKLAYPPSSTAALVCGKCGETYQIRNGIPRFIEIDQYAGSFSYEWTVHRTTQLDSGSQRSSERDFQERTGWGPEEVQGKRVLDVGCGMGRFADVVLRWGGEVYAVDLSFAVDAAHANLGANPAFHVSQASVFDLPFRPESFDLIFSLGVLHHTPDCERAFKALPRLLRPGGQIAIWVYSSHAYRYNSVNERRDRLYRRYTAKMSASTLHSWCRTLCRFRMRRPAFWHMALPGFIFHAVPGLHWDDSDYEQRVLNTFDWYSPKYQSKHSYPEVCRWFREADLTEIEPLDYEVSVRGRKPSRPESGSLTE